MTWSARCAAPGTCIVPGRKRICALSLTPDIRPSSPATRTSLSRRPTGSVKAGAYLCAAKFLDRLLYSALLAWTHPAKGEHMIFSRASHVLFPIFALGILALTASEPPTVE